MIGFATAGMDVSIIAPEGFQPRQEFVDRARKRATSPLLMTWMKLKVQT